MVREGDRAGGGDTAKRRVGYAGDGLAVVWPDSDDSDGDHDEGYSSEGSAPAHGAFHRRGHGADVSLTVIYDSADDGEEAAVETIHRGTRGRRGDARGNGTRDHRHAPGRSDRFSAGMPSFDAGAGDVDALLGDGSLMEVLNSSDWWERRHGGNQDGQSAPVGGWTNGGGGRGDTRSSRHA